MRIIDLSGEQREQIEESLDAYEDISSKSKCKMNKQ